MKEKIKKVLVVFAQSKGGSIFNKIIKSHDKLDFYLVGGAVRNQLIGYEAIKDFDIFINGTGFDEFIRKLSNYGVMEKTPYGSCRWFPNISGQYFDLVHFEDMSVGLDPPQDINELLSQFDITINALAINLRTEEFFNPCNGLEDIALKIIRGIRFDFSDEYVSGECLISPLSTLWFRIIHYSCKFNFIIDNDTLNWLINNQERIKFLDMFSKYFFVPCLDGHLNNLYSQ